MKPTALLWNTELFVGNIKAELTCGVTEKGERGVAIIGTSFHLSRVWSLLLKVTLHTRPVGNHTQTHTHSVRHLFWQHSPWEGAFIVSLNARKEGPLSSQGTPRRPGHLEVFFPWLPPLYLSILAMNEWRQAQGLWNQGERKYSWTCVMDLRVSWSPSRIRVGGSRTEEEGDIPALGLHGVMWHTSKDTKELWGWQAEKHVKGLTNR